MKWNEWDSNKIDFCRHGMFSTAVLKTMGACAMFYHPKNNKPTLLVLKTYIANQCPRGNLAGVSDISCFFIESSLIQWKAIDSAYRLPALWKKAMYRAPQDLQLQKSPFFLQNHLPSVFRTILTQRKLYYLIVLHQAGESYVDIDPSSKTSTGGYLEFWKTPVSIL